jgi:predicted ATP-binding protein involved in virulence
LVLLDEIENGINPEIIEKLVDALVQSPQQVLVTTHSPMILNFLDDAVARQAVQFIYKSPEGETRVRPFFSVPGIDAKLASMGPGEAFVDTDMVALAETCVALDATEAAARAAKELEGMV